MSQQAVSIEFTEDMHGFVSFSKVDARKINELTFKDYIRQGETGKSNNEILKFRLTITVDDIDQFCHDPNLQALATGYVECPKLGGKLPVEEGQFNLFVRPSSSSDFDTNREMHYRLYFKDSSGNDYTFYGYKAVQREEGLDLWEETTTLYTSIWEGKVSDPNVDDASKIIASGILRLTPSDFAKQMQTLKSNGSTFIERTSATVKFFSIFAGNLWEAYAPAFFGTDRSRWNEHIIPLQSLEGVRNCKKEQISFNTQDGLHLTLNSFSRENDSKDVVVLLHGLTTSTDMFVMPEHYNLVQYLLDNEVGEVISIDWRGSGRFFYNLEPHRYSVDDLALYDIPKAFETIREKVGNDKNIHVIAHCVGSMAFMASYSSGLVDGISSIISNSVSLTPKVRWQAKLKITVAPFLIEYIFGYPYLSTKMPYFPGPGFGRWIWWLDRLFRWECKEPACHMASFMWGWGFPACYEHENLHPVTHRRLSDLFGGTNLNYHRHINKMLNKTESIRYKHEGVYTQLPESYLESAKNREFPKTLLVSGDKNKIFPQSNKITHEELKGSKSGDNIHYAEFKGYGHQDIFMGKNCHLDVFPDLLRFIQSSK